jgi:ribonuclease HII
MASGLHVGIDENGLGPRLGPMVVTSVVARVTDGALPILTEKPTGGLADRLGDSKVMVAHGNMDLGEAWARAVAGRMAHTIDSPDDLVNAISFETRTELRAQCPEHVRDQCWSAEGEAFEANGRLVRAVISDLDDLRGRGVDVIQARSSIVCTRRLNDERSSGRSRFDVDLHAMERMILRYRERLGEDLDVVCGKVGGYARYSDAFGPLAGRMHAVVEQGPARSAYRFPDLGTIAFVRDADAGHILVSMASIVGKWVREILMARIVRFYANVGGVPPSASGYHDPVTAKLVAATAIVRTKRAIPDTCFMRTEAT